MNDKQLNAVWEEIIEGRCGHVFNDYVGSGISLCGKCGRGPLQVEPIPDYANDPEVFKRCVELLLGVGMIGSKVADNYTWSNEELRFKVTDPNCQRAAMMAVLAWKYNWKPEDNNG